MMPLTRDLCGVIGKAVSIIIVQCSVEALLTLSLVERSTYGGLHKTPFFSTPIQTLYYYLHTGK